jgi:CBS domain containing-hemolysin-like protein
MAEQLYTIIWIVLSLILIGFFAGYELAFISANRLSIELKKKQGLRSGIILSNFMESPAKFIGTCLIGLNIVLVVYGLLFTAFLKGIAWNPLEVENEYLKLIIDTIISTFVVLVFGEFIPKAIFKARNDKLIAFFAPVAQFFHSLLQPLASVFVSIAQWILTYIFNVRVNNKNEAFSKVDLEHFFQQTKDQDEENQELNTELFENALSLPLVKIRQCLVPRTEIEGADIHTSIENLKKQFIKTQLSKLVIYDDSVDSILGYVHQIDLFKRPATIQEILHPIIAVPESMSATDLINKFTKERKSIAWVVDEFGGTAGIVTMEDVLEEIFGEIRDEYDVFIFSGRLELDYLKEKYELDFPENESETLSGYIINKHEAIPKQKATIIVDHYQINVLTVSDTRIEMVKLKILR